MDERSSKRGFLSNPFVSALIIVAVIAIGIAVGTFVLSPYGSKSQLVWDEFRQQDNLDAVCLGSSLGAHAYDPTIVDELCGTSSFNMGTPEQEVAESYLGLKEAIEHHKLMRVYYAVDYAVFLGEPDLYPARVFMNEKWKGDSVLERFSDLAYLLDDTDWLFDERSINWLFPWTEQQPTGGVSGLFRNAAMRLDGTTLVQAAETNEKGWHYFGRGYGNTHFVVDYNADKQEDFATVCRFATRSINDEKLQCLADMADLCAANGIEFIAFAPALPEFSIISLADYYDEVSSTIRETVESHGGSFYDFNVADPSFYEPLEEHFSDFQHYNADGGRAFSESFAKLITARDVAPSSVTSWFTTYEQRLASIDHISTVQFTDHMAKGAVKLSARCFTGPNVKVEYQFQAISPSGTDFVTIHDWSTDSDFSFKPHEKGRYTIRVNVRQVGSDVEFERRTQHTVIVRDRAGERR